MKYLKEIMQDMKNVIVQFSLYLTKIQAIKQRVN